MSTVKITKNQQEQPQAPYTFVCLNTSRAAWQFNSYVDRNGEVCYVKENTDGNGNIIYRWFKFTPAQRIIKVPAARKDIYEFLKNHPDCEGSINSRGGKAWFKELSEAADAKIALVAALEKNKAESMALSLQGKQLNSIAVLLGCFSKDSEIQLQYVHQWASKNPQSFMDMVSSPDNDVRSLIRTALDKGVLTRKGDIIMWGKEVIGISEDAAVSKLMGEEAIRKGIELKASV